MKLLRLWITIFWDWLAIYNLLLHHYWVKPTDGIDSFIPLILIEDV